MKNIKTKLALAGVTALSSLLMLTGCGNYDHFDTVRQFDYAIVKFPDDTVKKLELKNWRDYDGEQIQITDTNGNTYLVSSFNCMLISAD